MSNEQQSGKMWSGRFREPLDAEFEAWQRSIVFDWRLLDQEIAASKAHASALCAAGILTKAETAELREALDAIAAEFASEAGKAQVRDHPTAEDIHHFVELKLVERIGALGAQAAHRPQPQRANRDGPAPLCARANRTRRQRPCRLGRCAGRAGARSRRSRDAELHAPAARRAGAGGALAAGLC